MNTIQAIWKNGQIVPIEPVDWPDGTALTVEPIEVPASDEAEDNIWGSDAASIARWIAAFDAIPPMIMSEAEEAEWQDARRQVKEYTIAKMNNFSIEGKP